MNTNSEMKNETRAGWRLLLAGALALLGMASGALAAAPVNDNFANARGIAGQSGTDAGTNVEGTKEVGEPNNSVNAGGKSVWYLWTAPSTGAYFFDTIGSDFDTILAVYTGGALAGLVEVAADDDSGGASTSKVSFTATAGVVYRVSVDGFSGVSGSIKLSWLALLPPVNDNFANAQVLSGAAGAVTGSNVLATAEVGEPVHAAAGGTSVWYQWTATSTGQFSFDTVGSSFNTLLAVYTGNAVGGLTLRASNDETVGVGTTSRVFFAATAGVVYRIAVDGAGAAEGSIRLAWAAFAAPANDNFASARAISGATGTSAGANGSATKQAGEPSHAGEAGGHSVWFRWTAPSSGLFSFDTTGSGFDGLLGIYTGTALASLVEEVSGGTDGTVTRVYLTATSGTLYRIALDGSYAGAVGATGNYALNWAKVLPPANDLFANATALTGRSGSVLTQNRAATKEVGEPNHAGDTGGASIWYKWTATESGIFYPDVSNGDVIPVLAVYTGSAVGSLVAVADNGQGGYVFTAGTVYRIALDGSGGEVGDIILDYSFVGANDFFATPKVISGASGTMVDDNSLATAEVGEPSHNNNAGAEHSLWFRWTAPATGPVWFGVHAADGSYVDEVVGVYTGGTLAAAVTVVKGSAPVIFNAVAGTVYQVAVDVRFSGGNGSAFTLEWLQAGPPANDALASAQVLTGNSGAATAIFLGATAEAGENVSFDQDGSGSVWYRWTAPASGVFSLHSANLFPAIFLADGSGATPFHLQDEYDFASATYFAGVHAGDVLTFRVAARALDAPTAGLTYLFTANASAFDLESDPALPASLASNAPSIPLLERTGTAWTLTVRRVLGELNATASVNVTVDAASTAIAGRDFSLSQTALIFAPGQVVKTLTITALNTAATDGVRDFQLKLVPVSNAVARYGVFAGRVYDDEEDPANNQLANAQVLAGATGSVPGTSVGADPDFSDPAIISDYLQSDETVWYRWTAPQSGAVSFLLASPAASIRSAVVVFSQAGTAAPVFVAGSSSEQAVWLAQAGTTYRILVNVVDNSGVTEKGASFALEWNYLTAGVVGIADVTVEEGYDAFATLTLTRTGGSDAFEVRVTTADYSNPSPGDPTPDDFTPVDQLVSFAVGEMSKTVQIPITDDFILEDAEKIYVYLGQDTMNDALHLAPDYATVTILDDETGGVISLDQTTLSVPEDGGPAMLTVSRSGITSTPASAGFTVAAGSATSADLSLASGTVNFAAGETSKVISIPLTDDTLDEPDETFTVTLTAPAAGSSLGAETVATVTIVDDDIPGVFVLSAATYSEGENAGLTRVLIQRTTGSDGDVSVSYTLTPGTATEGSDYSGTTGILNFANGESSKNITISLLDDTVDEPDETFTVTLSAPTAGSSLGTQKSAVVTLVDDDIPGVFAFSQATLSIAESGGSAVLTVQRTTGSDGAVSVSYTSTAGTAVAGKDFTAASGTLNFAHGETSKTIPIPILEDTFDENDKTFTVTLSNPTAGSTLGTLTSTTVTITDNDTFAPAKAGFSTLVKSGSNNQGLIVVKTTAVGKVSAKITLASATYSFSGALGVDGRAVLVLKKKGQPDATLTIQIGANQFAGTLNDGAGHTTTFEGAINDTGTKAAPVGAAGYYTAILRPPVGTATIIPKGNGWAFITISATGKTKVAGKLADGSTLSYAGAVDASDALPIFLPLYKKKGTLAGHIVFDPTQPTTDATAPGMQWVKLANAKDKLFPAGWPSGITTDLVASKFIAPAKVTAKNPTPFYVLGTHHFLGLPAPSTFALTLTDGGIPGFSNQATVDVKSKVLIGPATSGALGASKLTATLKATGAFTGSFTHPASGKATKFIGVILQKTHTAAGYFLTPATQSGAVNLAP